MPHNTSISSHANEDATDSHIASPPLSPAPTYRRNSAAALLPPYDHSTPPATPTAESFMSLLAQWERRTRSRFIPPRTAGPTPANTPTTRPSSTSSTLPSSSALPLPAICNPRPISPTPSPPAPAIPASPGTSLPTPTQPRHRPTAPVPENTNAIGPNTSDNAPHGPANALLNNKLNDLPNDLSNDLSNNPRNDLPNNLLNSHPRSDSNSDEDPTSATPATHHRRALQQERERHFEARTQNARLCVQLVQEQEVRESMVRILVGLKVLRGMVLVRGVGRWFWG